MLQISVWVAIILNEFVTIEIIKIWSVILFPNRVIVLMYQTAP